MDLLESSNRLDMESDKEIIAAVMKELDEIFDGQVSKYYKKHVIQNWSKEPYIQGSYSHYNDYSDMEILGEPIDNKVFFAGEALHEEANSTVHGAGESGFLAVVDMLRS